MIESIRVTLIFMLLAVLVASCKKGDSDIKKGDDADSTETGTNPSGASRTKTVLYDQFKNNNNKWFVGTSVTNKSFSAKIHGANDGMRSETYALEYGGSNTTGGYEYTVIPKDVFTAGGKKYIVECDLSGDAFSGKKSNSFYYGLVVNLNPKINRHTSFLLSTADNFSIYQGKADGSGSNIPLKGWTAYTPKRDGMLRQKIRIEVTANGLGSFFIGDKLVFSGAIGKMKPDRIALVVSGGIYCAVKYIKATQVN